jgi:hypothetical protein
VIGVRLRFEPGDQGSAALIEPTAALAVVAEAAVIVAGSVFVEPVVAVPAAFVGPAAAVAGTVCVVVGAVVRVIAFGWAVLGSWTLRRFGCSGAAISGRRTSQRRPHAGRG